MYFESRFTTPMSDPATSDFVLKIKRITGFLPLVGWK